MNPHLSPEELEALKHNPQTPKVAVGLPSVISSVKHVFGQMPISRGLKVMMKLNQKGGVDCPSCAWADPDGHRSQLGEYCENGAKAIADEAMTAKADAYFFEQYSINELIAQSDFWLGQQGRLAQPMIVREGSDRYEPITWHEAFTLIAEHLKELHSPDEAIFYTSGRSSNEAAFLYQLFVRQFGTNNLPDCSNMCHESSGVALGETLGLGKGSVTLDDFEHAEVIIVMGQNPGTNHPRMLTSLAQAKANGAQIVSINPLIEPGLLAFKNPQSLTAVLGAGVTLTDQYLQVNINGDLALFKALLILLFRAEAERPGTVFDQDFINTKTEGFGALREELNGYNVEQLSKDCGIALSEIQKLAKLLAEKQRIIVCWAMGITQHKNAVYTIREITNLLLLKGSIGKKGAGVCPVRGHSNVQGDRTMGIFHLPPQKLITKLKDLFGFDPPKHEGYDVVAAIKAMYEKKGKVFFALGGNFLAAAPDTAYTAQALRNCELTVHVSTKLNRSHLIHGKKGMILPCLGRADKDLQPLGEQFVSTENSMGVVQMSKGVLEPVSTELKSEPYIVARLAHEVLGKASQINWLTLSENYDAIRELIAQTIDGFDDMNAKVRQDGGFYLPNGPREAKFNTLSGKAKLTQNPWEATPLKANELMMMSIRSHDQFNTTIYGLNDRYRGIYNERRIVFMNADDIQYHGLEQYDIVDLYSHYKGVERKAEKFIIVAYDIPSKCVATYFPESNPLVPLDSVAAKSNTPTSKSVIITLKRIGKYLKKERVAEYYSL
jgi:molybdopterin-dependent oxidoreductase alpha subunit